MEVTGEEEDEEEVGGGKTMDIVWDVTMETR